MYTRRIPPQAIVTQEFARQLTEISHEIGRQVGVLVDRKGHVDSVIVGDASQIVLPVMDRSRLGSSRFNGLRCLHTHLRGEEGLTRDDLTDLAVLRLDLIAAIDVDAQSGLPGLIHAAHLLPASAKDAAENSFDRSGQADQNGSDGESNQMFHHLDPAVPSQMQVDFLELIESLEA